MAHSEQQRAAMQAMPTQELLKILRESTDTDALLTAAEILQTRKDADLPNQNGNAALKRFRKEFLPSTVLDPDTPEQPHSVGRLMRILPLAAVIVMSLAMLVYAGQQHHRSQHGSTAITRHGAETTIEHVDTEGEIPSFSIALPSRFYLDDLAAQQSEDTVIYRDAVKTDRSISLRFRVGQTVHFAPDSDDADRVEEITLPESDTPAFLIDRGDSVLIVFTDATHASLIMIEMEAQGLPRDDAIAAAASLRILP